MPAADIVIRGAREHNLRNVELVLPRNQLICLTGVSGSGKSSLAFDTVYAEGQRRYIESLSTFARQFLGQLPKPDVDFISGLSPTISISQKTSGNNPRSTVGTITEIYDYLRVLYARVGLGHCPQCKRPVTAQTQEAIIEQIAQLPEGTRFLILAPLVRRQKGEYRDLFVDLLKQGFTRARVDGQVMPLSQDARLDRQMRHDIEVVVDRLESNPNGRGRLAESVELALKVGGGHLIVAPDASRKEGSGPAPSPGNEPAEPAASGKRARGATRASDALAEDLPLSAHYACTHCGLSFAAPSPQLFSFNSPQGMCDVCHGIGESFSMDPDLLVPNGTLTFKEGAVVTVGPWEELGRWRQHLYDGVASTLEHTYKLPEKSLLETRWRDLPAEMKQFFLYGTDNLHITFTWPKGNGKFKYGGTYAGIIPELIEKHASGSAAARKQYEQYMRVVPCGQCHGQRLNAQARNVTLTTQHPEFEAAPLQTLPQVSDLSITQATAFFQALVLTPVQETIVKEVLKEIRSRLGFLLNVGLDYLTLSRTAPTLSGGESQRIRLAGQIGSQLAGVLYVLDEPSIGLHPRDNDRLLSTLIKLRDLGNTVIVVEHDEDTMRAADTIIDFGPGPGVRGGEVVAIGNLEDVKATERSVTGNYLAGIRKIEIPKERHKPGEHWLKITNCQHNNLRGVDVEIPLGLFVCVTGVSGSGKSSFVNDILVEALRRDLNNGEGTPGAHDAILGMERLDKLIAIDQSPIGRTPRSNPSTYIKLFDDIRALYAQLPDAKTRGYKNGRFSFNVSGGRCEACEGNGANKLEMDFLADLWVTCPVCEGRRFNRETQQIKFRGKSISEILDMDVQEALVHFENVPAVRHKLQTLHDVGLDYVKLGQPSPTLSGGEAQRIKLARELVKRSTGRTLYLLDEPTTGLHFADIEMLLHVLHDFVKAGNTVLVVEHNLDVIKTADWLIDLGPEGGSGGGQIIGTGTPEDLAKLPGSYTGRALAAVLEAQQHSANGKSPKKSASKAGARAKPVSVQGVTSIRVKGARQHNLKNVELEIPRDKMSVFCGPSGSGKSSLAMDTIYAEGQRRYVESLSSYARQFVGQMPKPVFESIEGLSPAIAIEQKNLGNSPRSTVGTVTEIYDYLRVLYSRIGEPFCPRCDQPIGTQTADDIVDKILSHPAGSRLYVMAPREVETGEKYDAVWDELKKSGYQRVRVNGKTYNVGEVPSMDRRRKHEVQVVVDRLVVKPELRSRITDSVESALSLGRGLLHLAFVDDSQPESAWRVDVESQHFSCRKCGTSYERLSPHHFSFNSSLGWCPICQGLGTQVGANPQLLIKDPKRSLRDGALLIWPELELPVARAMLDAFASHTGLSTDVPYEQLSPRDKRLVLYGTGDDWIEVKPAKGGVPLFKFQFKGIFPALEEAGRLSPQLRQGLDELVDEVECTTCGGSRLREDAAMVRFRGLTMHQLCALPLGRLREQMHAWNPSRREQEIAGELFREVTHRVQFLLDVGLDYLALGRSAPTLSGGEAQRIRLASQVGSGLTGVLYVLDEPTIGLHPRDNQRLINALARLRDLGNTLVLVEHDKEVIRQADVLYDFGPGAGKHGGNIVAQGPPGSLSKQPNSVTGPYLFGKKAIGIPRNRRLLSVMESPAPAAAAEADSGKTLSKARPAGKKPKADGTTQRPDVTAGQQPAAAAGGLALARSKPWADYARRVSPPGGGWLTVRGARHHNLKNVDVSIPLGTLCAVTGVSGSGKSSLVNDILHNALARVLHRARSMPGAFDRLEGLDQINKVIRVDQQPLGNTPSSNPATYSGVFDLIRQLFAQLPEAKVRGYMPRRFSFNVPGGRCEKCEGNGQLRVEMHFLPDVWVECDECHGKRYNPETLSVQFHGKSISDVLAMSAKEAVELFHNVPAIRKILDTLCAVGLDYLALGQSAPTLSGGEAQRVKLAAELARPDTGRTLYLLDEPTTGLHFDDLRKLLEVMQRLVAQGNTVLVVEHNLDVIKTADWIIDLGPEAGESGGQVVVAGTPEDVAAYAQQHDARPPEEAVSITAVPAENAAPGKRSKSKAAATVVAANASAAPAQRSRRAAPAPDLDDVILPAPFERQHSAGNALVSHTGRALVEILAAGPYVDRSEITADLIPQKREGDLEIHQVGEGAKMPWETNGRKWHTKDRVGRLGEPCRWDGRILERVVDKIQELGEFSETDWTQRSTVEIYGPTKSAGWFFHALTSHAWLVDLKFRVAKRTFKRDELVAGLNLPSLNDMPDLPVYSAEPRVKCKTLRGPWQEVVLRVHSLGEIDHPVFWDFLQNAIEGFQKYTDQRDSNPEDVMPWKQLGKKWHLSRKGFPPGKKPAWEMDVLEELCELLTEVAQGGQFLWNSQQVVHLLVKPMTDPWATIYTKRQAGLDLMLWAPKGLITLGRISALAKERQINADGSKKDTIQLRFCTAEDLHKGDLRQFLQDQLQLLAANRGK